MRSSAVERRALVRTVRFTTAELVVELSDGRTLMTPLAWYPRLLHATKTQRADWRLVGRGIGVHWAAVDEDLSVDGMLKGVMSQEPASPQLRPNAGAVRRNRKRP
jgi:hypothetical protein